MDIKTFRLKLRELAREDLEKAKEFFDSEYPRLVRETRMTLELREYLEVKKIGRNFLEYYANRKV
jgi:hypothetical protein